MGDKNGHFFTSEKLALQNSNHRVTLKSSQTRVFSLGLEAHRLYTCPDIVVGCNCRIEKGLFCGSLFQKVSSSFLLVRFSKALYKFQVGANKSWLKGRFCSFFQKERKQHYAPKVVKTCLLCSITVHFTEKKNHSCFLLLIKMVSLEFKAQMLNARLCMRMMRICGFQNIETFQRCTLTG